MALSYEVPDLVREELRRLLREFPGIGEFDERDAKKAALRLATTHPALALLTGRPEAANFVRANDNTLLLRYARPEVVDALVRVLPLEKCRIDKKGLEVENSAVADPGTLLALFDRLIAFLHQRTMGPPSAAARTRLEMAAVDNGFDLLEPDVGPWLAFKSSQAPMAIWLGLTQDERPVLALSMPAAARELGSVFTPTPLPLPPGAVAGGRVLDFATLHVAVRRAFQLSRSLPDQPLIQFQILTADLPRKTEAERLVVQRVGQDVFRDSLLEYWNGRCAVTGLAVPDLLRASHIKPWAVCETDAERLDIFNGLLLAPQFDAAFDRGFITISDDGRVVVSPALGTEAAQALGIGEAVTVPRLAAEHRRYLAWHRERVFKR